MREAPACVYRFFDGEGDLLYVGCTISPSRIEHHRFIKAWWTAIANITVVHYPTRRDALFAERTAIRDEFPLFNVKGARSRPMAVAR